MLSTIAGAFGGKIIDSILGQATQLFTAYIQKKITEEELRAGLVRALTQAFVDVEKAYAESVTKTFASFMEAAAKSKLMQATWAAVALSQLAVILWFQVGIPALMFWFYPGKHYPGSGTTAEWAYALVMFCLGGGAMALRPSAGGGIIEKIKGMIGIRR